MIKTQKEVWDAEYSQKGAIWNREPMNLPKILKGKRILELGAGNGKTLKSILRQKPSGVVAIDFSKQAIAQCKKTFQNFSHLTLLEADILALPFNNKDFDIVFCYYVLNNLMKKERKKAINEIKRVLKPKGRILFEDFAVGDFRHEKGAKSIEKNTIKKKNNIICHFFTEKEVKSLFKLFGKIKIKQITSKPIKHKSLERKILSALIEK